MDHLDQGSSCPQIRTAVSDEDPWLLDSNFLLSFLYDFFKVTIYEFRYNMEPYLLILRPMGTLVLTCMI